MIIKLCRLRKSLSMCLNRDVDLAKVWENYKIPIILGAASFMFIALAGVLLVKSIQTTTPIEFSSEASVAGTISTSIHIDIEGAVQNPGVYELPSGSRVEDAIVASGGFSGEADYEGIASSINRAAKLVDGAKLYIPKVGVDVPTSYNLELSSVLVNINSASQSELEGLSGVGPVTAQKIISNRPYQTLEELISKKAIGQSLFEKLKNQLAL